MNCALYLLNFYSSPHCKELTPIGRRTCGYFSSRQTRTSELAWSRSWSISTDVWIALLSSAYSFVNFFSTWSVKLTLMSTVIPTYFTVYFINPPYGSRILTCLFDDNLFCFSITNYALPLSALTPIFHWMHQVISLSSDSCSVSLSQSRVVAVFYSWDVRCPAAEEHLLDQLRLVVLLLL